ncbi:putative deoxyribonuclease tatdn3 isoform X1 [Platichthys flesus]|uniref:putative deoxyribonuclease tatdn3 isoform X1 n=1 Tax=Platichthys flesus TaxID=8260 RepID=UPI002DBC157E|nr:putative deoxyribonuclease tatdn3 isoform X1 [Platichthys flesus]
MELGFVDSHCHISAREFEQDLEDVMQRSRQLSRCGGSMFRGPSSAGRRGARAAQRQASGGKTDGFHSVDSDLTRSVTVPTLLSGIRGRGGSSAGEQRPLTKIHNSGCDDLDAALPLLYEHRERLVAVGEIGLDFTPWRAPTQQGRDDQMSVFVKQLDVAKELDLPVNVHSRSAARVTIETMRQQGISRALLHNFAGKPSVALEGVKAGYLFSFPPAVCRNQQRDKLIRAIPLEHICLETDSPALGLDKGGTSPVTSSCAAGTSPTSKVCPLKPFSSSRHRMRTDCSPGLTRNNAHTNTHTNTHTVLKSTVWPEEGEELYDEELCKRRGVF